MTDEQRRIVSTVLTTMAETLPTHLLQYRDMRTAEGQERRRERSRLAARAARMVGVTVTVACPKCGLGFAGATALNIHRGKYAACHQSWEERFWSKVDMNGPRSRLAAGRCWLWIGELSKAGYGRWTPTPRVHRMAHRQSWEYMRGPIPGLPGTFHGMTLDHLCKNPPCVNPAHLEPVTIAENLRRGIRHGEPGERNGQARLTTADVLTIRRESDLGTPHSVLATRYGVTGTHISQIVQRRRWRHVA